AEEAGRQRDQRHEEQQQQVHPHQLRRGAANDSQQLMMIDPEGSDYDETQRIDRELRRERRHEAEPNLARGCALRQPQLEHHDGDDDGDDAVTEGGDALGPQTATPSAMQHTSLIETSRYPPSNSASLYHRADARRAGKECHRCPSRHTRQSEHRKRTTSSLECDQKAARTAPSTHLYRSQLILADITRTLLRNMPR